MVAIDPSAAFEKAITSKLSNAAIGDDPFHLVQLANPMVTRVQPSPTFCDARQPPEPCGQLLQALPRLVRVLVDAIAAPDGDGGRRAHDAADLVALGQEQFGQLRTVLAGDAGDRRCSHPTLVT